MCNYQRSVFYVNFLRSIARVSWSDQVRNVEVGNSVFGKRRKSVDKTVNHHIRWLGHILHIPNGCRPQQTMLLGVEVGWNKAMGTN